MARTALDVIGRLGRDHRDVRVGGREAAHAPARHGSAARDEHFSAREVKAKQSHWVAVQAATADATTSMCSRVCAVETNHVSKALGGR